jgi:hypothetical protein
MDDNLIYLDTYVLQQDMRIRMPKSILKNLNAEKGKTNFAIYLNKDDKTLVLKLSNSTLEK